MTAIPEAADVLNTGASDPRPRLMDGALEKDEIADPEGPRSIRPCDSVVQAVFLGRPGMGLTKTRPPSSMGPPTLPFDSRPTTSITSRPS